MSMVDSKNLSDKLTAYCEKIGVDIVGFCDPAKFNIFEIAHTPESFLKDSKTVIVIAFYLFDLGLDAWSKDKENDRNFHFADSILLGQCHQIKSFLAKCGFKSKIIPYKPGLYLKDAAALAGIGPIGKNNLLITEKFGSQERLRALATNAELLYGKTISESRYCKNCSICVDSCPADALKEGNYNEVLCRKYCLENLKDLSDDTVLWCNICIEMCPIGKR